MHFIVESKRVNCARRVQSLSGTSLSRSVRHVEDSDTLLVGESHVRYDYWLVSLRRRGSESRETPTVEYFEWLFDSLTLCAVCCASAHRPVQLCICGAAACRCRCEALWRALWLVHRLQITLMYSTGGKRNATILRLITGLSVLFSRA